MAYNDLTNMLTANPWLFDPSQQSNQFSNYNNAPLPGPSYNPGLAGGPVNAATGQPIASYQQWAQANPGGMTLNQTPAQPQAPQQGGGLTPQIMNQLNFNARQLTGNATGGAANQATTAQVLNYMNNMPGPQYNRPQLSPNMNSAQASQAFLAANPGFGQGGSQPGAGQPGQSGGAAAGASGAPNNWMAALNALANPGNVATPGATVPQATGSQPAGGVNQAWLNQIGGGQGMNQNFINALRSIQGR